MLYYSWGLVSDGYDNESNADKKNEIGKKFLIDNKILINEIEFTISKIKLSLNPKKDSAMLLALKAIQNAMQDPTNIQNSENIEGSLLGAMTNMERLSHELFKTEWERVKTGEPIYCFSKWAMILIGVGFLITIVQKYITS